MKEEKPKLKLIVDGEDVADKPKKPFPNMYHIKITTDDGEVLIDEDARAISGAVVDTKNERVRTLSLTHTTGKGMVGLIAALHQLIDDYCSNEPQLALFYKMMKATGGILTGADDEE